MRSLKINFGGAGATSLAWDEEVSGISAVGQKAAVSLLTRLGSDKFLPERGTSVSATVFSYGVFDLMGMQHTLNFGALKARADMQDYEGSDLADSDKVSTIKMTLVSVSDNSANVSVVVTNKAGDSTREITSIT